jgi:hypothetical protein
MGDPRVFENTFHAHHEHVLDVHFLYPPASGAFAFDLRNLLTFCRFASRRDSPLASAPGGVRQEAAFNRIGLGGQSGAR